MSSMNIHRRSLLKGTGATALGAAILRPLIARAESGPPKRLVIIHRPCGTVPSLFWPQGNSGGDFALPSILSAFASTRADMVVLNQVNAPRGQEPIGDEHGTGNISILSGDDPIPLPGAKIEADSQNICARSKTIDQILADTSPLLRGTSHKSIQLGADRQSGSGVPANKVMSYSGPGPTGALWPETRPDHALTKVFGSFMPGTTDNSELLRLRQQGKGVFDKVSRDIERMQSMVPQSQRLKLEEQLDALRQLDRQLALSAGSGSLAAGCAKPLLPPLPNQAGSTSNPLQFGATAKQMLQIIRAAFLCDITRVASFSFSHGISGMSFDQILPQSVKHTDPHHEISHGDEREALGAIDKWYCEQVNQFLLDLKNTPEGDGTSMLDNTLVFYFSEIYDGPSHSNENVPVTLHGGRALGLKGGRHLKYGGRSTNDIWAAIAQAFGVPMAKFGAPQLGQGAVGDLFG